MKKVRTDEIHMDELCRCRVTAEFTRRIFFSRPWHEVTLKNFQRNPIRIRAELRQPTWTEDDDRLQATVLRRVDVQSFQLFHLLLENADVIHEGDHSIRGHGAGVESCRCQQRSHVKGHGTLGGIQDEEFAPAQSQESHLVGYLEIWKEGNVSGPFHRAEEKSGCQLANVFDAHEVVGLHAVASVPGRARVWLCPKKHGHEAAQVAGVVAIDAVHGGPRIRAERHQLTGVTRVLVWRYATPLNCCKIRFYIERLLLTQL